jgi:predicted nucleic acid-binding protein
VLHVLVLDTSFLVSFFRSGDSNHSKAVELFQKHRSDEMLLTDEILFETLSVLNVKDGMELARLAHRELAANSRLMLIYLNEGERKEILDEFLAQAGNLSVADICVVHACKKTFSTPLAFDRAIVQTLKHAEKS